MRAYALHVDVWTQININKKQKQKTKNKKKHTEMEVWTRRDMACRRVGAWMCCVFLWMQMVDGGVDALRVCVDAL